MVLTYMSFVFQVLKIYQIIFRKFFTFVFNISLILRFGTHVGKTSTSDQQIQMFT